MDEVQKNINKLSKKTTQKEVFEKLSIAFADYKSSLNKKKFENKLKKASKLISVDIVKAIKKDRKSRRAK